MSEMATALDQLSGALETAVGLIDELRGFGCVLDSQVEDQLYRVLGAAKALRRSLDAEFAVK